MSLPIFAVYGVWWVHIIHSLCVFVLIVSLNSWEVAPPLLLCRILVSAIGNESLVSQIVRASCKINRWHNSLEHNSSMHSIQFKYHGPFPSQNKQSIWYYCRTIYNWVPIEYNNDLCSRTSGSLPGQLKFSSFCFAIQRLVRYRAVLSDCLAGILHSFVLSRQ